MGTHPRDLTLVDIQTPPASRLEPGATAQTLEGARGVQTSSFGTGVGLSALVYVLALPSPALGIATLALAGVGALCIDAAAARALVGHVTLVHILAEPPVLSDDLAVTSVAVASVGAKTVNAVPFASTGVAVALINV